MIQSLFLFLSVMRYQFPTRCESVLLFRFEYPLPSQF